MANSIKYRPEIDGLRALAILPVIIFHLGAKWLPGGFVGVDVFFVISGYLISSIILAEHASHAFSLNSFWMRRVRRIMPAMLLMLLVTAVAGRFILFGASWALLGGQVLSTLGLSANMLIWHITRDYWGPTSASLPLLHNWSLSVEEQFYVVYPVVILACLKWFPRRLLPLLAAIFSLSLVLCVVVTYWHPSWSFYFLPTRAWELAGGCFLAGWQYSRNGDEPAGLRSRGGVGGQGANVWLAVLGVILIALSWVLIDERHFPGYKAAMPVIGAMLVIQFTGGMSCPVTGFLSYQPIRYVGKISYSLYLWHWPVIVLMRAARVRWENIPFWPALVLIPLVAVLAYHLVEVPGRRLRNPFPLVIPGLVVVSLFSVFLISSKPAYDLARFDPTIWMGEAYDSSPHQMPVAGTLKARLDGVTIPLRNAPYGDVFKNGGILKPYGGEKLDILVIGNSHALMWAPVIDNICRDHKLTVLFYAAEGMLPYPTFPPQKAAKITFTAEEWFAFDTRRIKLISEDKPRLIIMGCKWNDTPINEELKGFLNYLSKQNSKLLLIEDPPELAIGDINAPEFLTTTSSSTVRVKSLEDLADDAAKIAGLKDNYDFIKMVSIADLFLTAGERVRARDGRSVFYIDDNHLSVAGARLAKDRIWRGIADSIQTVSAPPN